MDLCNCCFRAKMLNDYEITNVKANTLKQYFVPMSGIFIYFLKATFT